jgi:hypothetical protein
MDAKTTYAQSSDIKSRTYLEYRRDMKKKAIAELEILEWLQEKLANIYKNRKAIVLKSGGDSFLWFLRKGGITREPDFEVRINNEKYYFEFQYADRVDLDFYDFKISKVGKKVKNNRVPHTDKKFIYIIKPTLEYAIFDPIWIIKNGKYGMVPAWRSSAYRVPKNKFKKILIKDNSLKKICETIDAKNFILNYQHQLIDITKDNLSHLLQKVVDEEKIVKIIPNNLESFFKICFILNNLNKTPTNTNLWLIYLLSYVSEQNTTEDLYKILYCVDFLYSKLELEKNELSKLISGILKCKNLIKKFEQKDGTFKSSLKLSPENEIRYALFSINLLEDLTQDIIHYYKTDKLKPIQKIYQSINYIDKVLKNIK